MIKNKKYHSKNKIGLLANNILIIFVMLSFLFTSSKFGNQWMQLMFLSIPLIIILFLIIQKQKFNIGWNYIWLPFFALVVLQNLYYFNFNNVFMYFLLLIIMIEQVIYGSEFEFNKIFKLIIMFSTVYALSCIVQIIYPDIILKIQYFLFDGHKLKTALGFFYGKRYHTGITYQADVTAGYIVFGIFALMTMKKIINKGWYLLIIIHLVGLVLTAKRAHLLFLLLTIVIVEVLKSSNKQKIKSFLKYSLIMIVFLFIIYEAYLYTGSSTLARYIDLVLNHEDVSSGRMGLWKDTINLIKNNLFFGVGWGQYIKITGQYTQVHNVYLQLLCECGLFGLILFMLPSMICLKNTIQSLKRGLQYSTYTKLLKFSAYMQVFFLLYCFSGNPLYDKQYYIGYFIASLVLNNKYRILQK